MNKSIKKLLPGKLVDRILSIKNHYLDGYSIKSYSQEGEDMILHKIFANKRLGFYVDIGAHHPFRFSNTYFFYKKGWKGINIDAAPGSMQPFNRFRPQDLNLEYAISDFNGVLPYYIFKEPALNTFSQELAHNYIEGGQNLLRTEMIEQYPLYKILDDHLDYDIKIDFMSVDAEGFDLQVLKSNNWNKYLPPVILVESLDFELVSSGNSEIYDYLAGIGYELFAKTINTLFFKIKN